VAADRVPSRIRALVAAAAAGVTICAAVPAAQTAELDAVLARSAEYTSRFVDVFSNLVATERYTQDVKPANTAMRLRWRPVAGSHRELRSDFLLLNVGGPLDWRPYRDVYLVDGKPVRDRDDRLTRLFTEPAGTRLEQAARIAQESARHNIGLARRTANTPVLSLLFLQEHIQSRFEFRIVDRNTTGDGGREIVLEYREDLLPTIIRGLRERDDDTDLPATGRFTIDSTSGRVAHATLVLSTGDMRTTLATTYRDEPRFGIAVPVEMRETIELDRALVTGRATYDNFRRFEVKTETATKP
jgi:hypothetical protein